MPHSSPDKLLTFTLNSPVSLPFCGNCLVSGKICVTIPRVKRLLLCLAVAVSLCGCFPPSVQYPDTVAVVRKRGTLKEHLLQLLPTEQQGKAAAQEEAAWLSDTAYKASAGISRVNDSNFPGWFGNALINLRIQDRGLCWHYQHDLFRELRRRPLTFFRIGCCVRDKAERSEHNCVYIAAAEGEWPQAWVLDAWKLNGRLCVDDARELNPKRWKDLPDVCAAQQTYYPEGHRMPVEYWSVVRGTDGSYEPSWGEEARRSEQYKRMYDNILRGREEHPNSLINY